MSSAGKKRKVAAKASKAATKKPTQTDSPVSSDDEADRRTRDEHAAAREWLSTLAPTDVLSKDLFDADRIAALRSEFANKLPFPHCTIENFVDSQFLAAMLEELKNLDYASKNNDLYNFSQSEEDLKCVTFPLVTHFRELLYSPATVAALSQISGIPLYGLDSPSQPDFFAAVYSDKSRLLCHDDELEGRRIAFIVYLAEEGWADADGGQLDLFNTDAATGQPADIAVSYVPKWGSFTFFEVSPKSYHQVREVLSKNKLRVSMGGWFHGPPITRKAPVIEPVAAAFPPVPAPVGAAAGGVLPGWVNKQYTAAKIVPQIKAAFSEDSSLELHNFISDALYKEILGEIVALEKTAFPNVAANGTAADAKTPVPAAEAEAEANNDDDDGNDDESDEEDEEDEGETPESAKTATTAAKKGAKGKAKGKAGTKSKGAKAGKAGKGVKAKAAAAKKASATAGAGASEPLEPAVLPALMTYPVPGLGLSLAGPANFRCFYEQVSPGQAFAFPQTHPEAAGAGPQQGAVFSGPSVTPKLDALVEELKGEKFAKFIETVTGMTVSSVTPPSRRLFRRGCYTLAHDHELETLEEALDVTVTFMVPKAALKWDESDGGSIHYLQAGADEELLTVMPVPNAVTMVYRAGASTNDDGTREGGVMQFTRYLSHTAPGFVFQVKMTYRGLEGDDDDDAEAGAEDGADE